MKVRSAFLVLAALILLTGSLWAQHDHSQMATQPPADSQPAPADDMVTACHHHLSRVKDLLVKLDAAVTDVQNADTPAKKHAAQDSVRSFADQMKMHLDMCPIMRAESTQEMGDMKSMGSEKQKEEKKD